MLASLVWSGSDLEEFGVIIEGPFIVVMFGFSLAYVCA